MTSCFTQEQINKINHLVREVEKLSDVEKLFLYLQLPCGSAATASTPDEMEVTTRGTRLAGHQLPATARLNGNLFTRKLDQETTQTYTWILSHLEVDQNVSLPKQEVYDEYKSFCQANRFEPLCVADFGKAMKHTFPCIKPRRLGHRGNSRYCYSGLRKKYKIMAPSWPEMTEEPAARPQLPGHESSPTHGQARNSQTTTTTTNTNTTSSSTMILNGKPDGLCTLEVRKPEDRMSHHASKSSNGMELIMAQKQCNESMCMNQEMEIVVQSRGPTQLASMELAGSTCPLISTAAAAAAPAPATTSSPLFACNQPYFNYNYPQTIHQPGTPDDDDYQHNYQHKEGSLINRQFGAASSSKPASSAGAACTSHLCQPTDQSPMVGYTRVAPTLGNGCGSMAHHHQHQQPPPPPPALPLAPSNDPMLAQASGFCLDSSAGISSSTSSASTSGVPSTTSSMGSNNVSSYMSLHGRLNAAVGHIDTYASPFQSPASTPYPSTSSTSAYMNHSDSPQDYFAGCDSSMQHYTSS